MEHIIRWRIKVHQQGNSQGRLAGHTEEIVSRTLLRTGGNIENVLQCGEKSCQ